MSRHSIKYVGIEGTIASTENVKPIPFIGDFHENNSTNSGTHSSQPSSCIKAEPDDVLSTAGIPSTSNRCHDVKVKKEIFDLEDYGTSYVGVDDTIELSYIKSETVVNDPSEYFLKCEVEDTTMTRGLGTEHADADTKSPRSDHKRQKCPECTNTSTEEETHKCVHFECPECDKWFVTKTNLKVHRGAVHLTTKKHKCSYCNKSFARRDQSKQHQVSKHLNIKALLEEHQMS